jgi:hypothetical protein
MGCRTITCAVIGALALNGCAFQKRTARMALDHNEFAAQATNRQTVLNILRARDRSALHFTSFGNISGKVNLTALGEASAIRNDNSRSRQFNADGDPTQTTRGIPTLNATVRASATVTTGTDFTLAVNATDEFYKGIMGPVTQPVIIHYLEQGWPADLLSFLFLRRIEFYAGIRQHLTTEDCRKRIQEASDAGRNAPDDCTKELGDYRLLSVANSADRTEDSAPFAELIRCRRLAVGQSSPKATEVRFDQLSQIGGITDTNLPKVVDRKPANDRYGVDFGRRAPVLTLALTGDPLRTAQQSGEQDPERLKRIIAKDTAERCGPTRFMIQDAFARMARVAAAYPADYPHAVAAIGSLPAALPVPDSGPNVLERAPLPLGVLPVVQGYEGRCIVHPQAERRSNPLLFEAQVKASRGDPAPAVAPSALLEPMAWTVPGPELAGRLGSSIDPLLSRNYFGASARTGYEIDLKVLMTLRSVEGIIYYLGEYVRRGAGPCVRGYTGDQLVPILTIYKGKPRSPHDAFAEVDYRGDSFWVPITGPGIEADRSSQVINLVQQLLNLHRTSKELPTVQTVRVAN